MRPIAGPYAWITEPRRTPTPARGSRRIGSVTRTVFGIFSQYVPASGQRSPNVMAKALITGFQRIVHRVRPAPVGSRLRVTRYRHLLARKIFHGQRGELRQAYREGQEDQLGALGLVLNAVVLWNTRYTDAAVAVLRAEGHPVRDEDVARLSPLGDAHINMLGRYAFTARADSALRPLRDLAQRATSG